MDYALMRERLVKAREFIGQNRKEFAETLNMSYRTITNYENGSREPGSDYIAKVADVCGCTTDWLLGLSDDARCHSPYSSLLTHCSVDYLLRGQEDKKAPGVTEVTLGGKDFISMKKSPPSTEDGLSASETEIIRHVRALTPDQVDFLLAWLKTSAAEGQ